MPKVRQRIKETIERDLIHDENVISVFYGGSIGSRSTDLYSDIDLRIVVRDEAFEDYRLNKRERAQHWGKVMFYEDFPWASHSVAHYENFIKVDSFYYTKKDILPSVWLKEIEVVYDRDLFMQGIQKKSQELIYEPTFAEFEIWRNKFFAYSHEVYRGVKRGEFFYAMSSLDTIRLFLTTGWFMEAGVQPNNPGYWAKLGGDRSRLKGWQESFLERTLCRNDEKSIMESMSIMVPEFRRIHKVLCEKFGIEEDRCQVNKIFSMIL
ncbi:aminoglycoside 6-adenylyltransferase [Bacillus salacetis]|uniref:aminoglycoside 6-adenylyltransferase n=1 Tax=Bacillus salacetis TaxID=2315464 RepID=UPI003BA2F068